MFLLLNNFGWGKMRFFKEKQSTTTKQSLPQTVLMNRAQNSVIENYLLYYFSPQGDMIYDTILTRRLF